MADAPSDKAEIIQHLTGVMLSLSDAARDAAADRSYSNQARDYAAAVEHIANAIRAL